MSLKPGKLLIGGEWRDAASGAAFTTINPATEEVLAEVAEGREADVELAIRAARKAFDEGPWPRMSGADRAKALWKLADLIESKAKEIAELETLDCGKPITDTTRVDIPLTVAVFRYYAGFADKIQGETIPTRGSWFNYTLREPLGVIACIVPWNYPLLLASYKVAPALACGNVVILKPASQTPLSALKLGELALEAGIPAGVLNVITGPGGVVGNALASSLGVDKVALTGSTETGRKVMAAAAKNCTKVQLELGGKSPNIIFADSEIDKAAAGATFGIFANKGEICTAGSRLFVESKVHDEVVGKIVERATKMKQGDPLDPKTRIGPQVSKEQRDSILGFIETGKKEGGKLVTGGAAPEDLPKGYFVKPTVFTDVANEMTIAREEIFGPVLSVIRFDGFDDLIRQANNTMYGLAAGVWTRDIKKAHKAAKLLQAGTVWINTYNIYDPGTPFGGFKRSGFGRELGAAAIDEYTHRKSVWVELGD
ncbi:MAG TPA: aldehyde dehydrogenase family protein [Planctomycetota bacterium]|nr:aldehyde dehydrogenase family protein [Planctomycetota bacterium]